VCVECHKLHIYHGCSLSIRKITIYESFLFQILLSNKISDVGAACKIGYVYNTTG